MKLLRCAGLALGYGNQALLNCINLTLESGRVYCLLGSNGCGKSTLLRAIAGVQPVMAGEIELAGRPLGRWSIAQRARLIAWVPQQHHSPFAYSVLDMVMMGSSAGLGPFSAPGGKQRALARAMLAKLGISKLASRSYPTLSGGERQLVLLARAMVQQPRLMLLDEPAASLDFGHQIALLEKIHELKSTGMTMLMATHHPLHASAIADEAILAMPDGTVRQGPPQTLLTCASLAKLYRVSEQEIARWLILRPDGQERIAC